MRDLDQIDRELEIERAWWQRECRRAGSRRHALSEAAFAKIDDLLAERSDVLRTLRSEPPRPEHARLVRQPAGGKGPA